MRTTTIALCGLLGGCSLWLDIDDTTEVAPVPVTVRAEGIIEPVTVRLTGVDVDEMLEISADGELPFASTVSPTFAVTLVGGPACVLSDNAVGAIDDSPIVVDLTCKGVTQLVALSAESLSRAPLVPYDETSYQMTVSELQQSTRITATPRSSAATVKIADVLTENGALSAALPIDDAVATISILVEHPASAALSTTYTITVQRTIPLQHASFLKAFPAIGDSFGWTVATDGTRVVSGAPNEGSLVDPGDPLDAGAPQSGAAYVFARQGTMWAYESAVKAPNAQTSDGFGYSVGIDGDWMVVGAPFEDSGSTNTSDNSVSDAGAAYVFHREQDEWVFVQYLKSTHPKLNGNFGWSVAISGDTIVVGSFRDDQYSGATLTANACGQAYVFRRAGSAWTLEQALGPDQDGAGFGYSVAVAGDRIVAGMPNGHPTMPEAGGARIFGRTGTTWTLEAEVVASNAGPFDFFGAAVATDGTTVAIAAPHTLSATGQSVSDVSGFAYVFEHAGGTWTEQQLLSPVNGDPDDEFGRSIAIAGGLVAVGAFREDGPEHGIAMPSAINTAEAAGAVYMFARSGSTWSHSRYIKGPENDASDGTGTAVALSREGVLVVGAPGESSNSATAPTNNSLPSAGACYVLH